MRMVLCALLIVSALALGAAGGATGQEHHFGNDRDKAFVTKHPPGCTCGASCKCGTMPGSPFAPGPALPKKLDDFLDKWSEVPARCETAFWGMGLITGAIGGLFAGLGIGVLVARGKS